MTARPTNMRRAIVPAVKTTWPGPRRGLQSQLCRWIRCFCYIGGVSTCGPVRVMAHDVVQQLLSDRG